MPGHEYPYTVRSNSINNSRYQAAMNSSMVKKMPSENIQTASWFMCNVWIFYAYIQNNPLILGKLFET